MMLLSAYSEFININRAKDISAVNELLKRCIKPNDREEVWGDEQE